MAVLFAGRGDRPSPDNFVVPDQFRTDAGDLFEIGERIAPGGNAVVHQCLEVATGSEFAVKFQLDLRVDRRKRFLREQTLTSSVSHDHLVKYEGRGSVLGSHHTRGRDPKSTTIPFIVMERAQSSLADLVRAFDIPKEVYYAQFRGLADALGVLHAQAFHRDIKPENILVVGDRWVLSDYGLCDLFDTAPEDRFTPDWAVIGPRFWMSPEANNRSVGKMDDVCAASDVFQLASVFWYVVNRSHPTGVLSRTDWCGPDPLFDPIHLALHYDMKARPANGADFAAQIAAAILS